MHIEEAWEEVTAATIQLNFRQAGLCYRHTIENAAV